MSSQSSNRLPDSPITRLPDSCDVAVVGAGAAGLATAIFARRVLPSHSIVVLEGAKKPGAKILISGGGRCNVTNSEVTDADFWGGRRTIVRQILRALPAAETIAWFREMGVPLHEEAGGKLFPNTNRARDVVDALVAGVAAAGVPIVANCRVLEAVREAGGFRVTTSRGTLDARVLVLATGGRSLPKSGSDGAGYAVAEHLGHGIVATTPGLVPFTLGGSNPYHQDLAGVSHDVELTIWAQDAVAIRLRGALLWTHFGISGPVALDASRHWARARLLGHDTRVTVNFCPGQSFDDLDRRLARLPHDRPKGSIHGTIATLVPASVATLLLREVGVEPSGELSHLSRDHRRRIVHALTEWTLEVSDTRGYNYAEVTAGGVALTDIDPSTMRSRICPGLYLVGEILDVDGRVGGFNFQWAWSSAFVAARGLSTDRRL